MEAGDKIAPAAGQVSLAVGGLQKGETARVTCNPLSIPESFELRIFSKRMNCFSGNRFPLGGVLDQLMRDPSPFSKS